MVIGGVNFINVKDWFLFGVIVIGIGGEFNKLVVLGEFDKIIEMVK